MVTGWPPFYADEPMKTYEKIVACAVSFPVYITRQLSDLVSKLLTTQPGKRLGNLKGGINDIVKHKWFGSFDWAGLEALTIPAPYLPAVSFAPTPSFALIFSSIRSRMLLMSVTLTTTMMKNFR